MQRPASGPGKGLAIVIGVGKPPAKSPSAKPNSGKVGYGAGQSDKGKSMASRDAADKAYDKSHGIKQGSAADKAMDKKNGVYGYEYGSKGGGKVGVGGTLSAGQRNALPAAKFGLPGKGSGTSGKGSGSYPMPDKSHAANAKARASQQAAKGNLSANQKAQIDRKANAVLGSSRTTKGGK